MLATHPGGGAGQPVTQFPFAVVFAATPAADLHGDAAADLSQRLVGQLHQMEVVHDQRRAGQGLADRGLEDRAHVDRDVADRVAPGLLACGQPVDDDLGVSAFNLPEQALPGGQVDKPNMPAVHRGLPRAGDLIEGPLWTASADLIDTEHRHRHRLGREHLLGVVGERRGHHRPGQVVVAGGLHHRATPVGHCRGGRGP